MKLFFLIFISVQTFCLSQYVYGRGIYFSLDLSYQKKYLKESQTTNGNITDLSFGGDGVSYGFNLIYAVNLQHYFSLAYNKSSETIIHQSKFFIYSDKDIEQRSSHLEHNTIRGEYNYFFRYTRVFVGAGIEISIINLPRENLFAKKYKERVTGLMLFGTRIGDPHFMFLPYISYAVPLMDIRKSFSRSISLTELRLGLRIVFRIL